uniref:probable membrane-associated kinase regulator 6 n=1 Tax=Erigeron canadensis TaxID=72917 RepID=UPI001CB88CC0|nr:probable membrane-associated kinase regulator 6 [Erigeron canadensis]
METSESLSIESFSYSWLVNLKPSFESPKGSFRDSFDESNFIEMDPKLSASQRFLVFHQDFNFDQPTFQPCVHADELISNGILVPLFLKPLDVGIYNSSSNSTPISPMSPNTLEKSRSLERSRSLSFRRYKRLPKRVVQKYLNLVRLIWLRMRRGRCDANALQRVQRTNTWEFSGTIEACGSDNWSRSWVLESPKSCASSPRITDAYGVDNCRRSCDSECSIYEAVLHCKKTIGCK